METIAKENTMTRISTFCVLSSTLAVIALSANGASAATITVPVPRVIVHVPQPKVTVQTPQPKVTVQTPQPKVTVQTPQLKILGTHSTVVGTNSDHVLLKGGTGGAANKIDQSLKPSLDAAPIDAHGRKAADVALGSPGPSFSFNKIDPGGKASVAAVIQAGTQAGGAGAGKITFNPFSITRKIDIGSPSFFAAATSGASFSFNKIDLTGKTSVVSVVGQNSPAIPWAHDVESPKETVTFEYGGLTVSNPKISDGLSPNAATALLNGVPKGGAAGMALAGGLVTSIAAGGTLTTTGPGGAVRQGPITLGTSGAGVSGPPFNKIDPAGKASVVFVGQQANPGAYIPGVVVYGAKAGNISQSPFRGLESQAQVQNNLKKLEAFDQKMEQIMAKLLGEVGSSPTGCYGPCPSPSPKVKDLNVTSDKLLRQ
jgi:hypothetical protein